MTDDDLTTKAQQAHDYLLKIGDLTVRFAAVDRAPRYPDGDRETDVEHSFHLAISAMELAADYYPELDVGLVAQFSLVHDLPESYTGDVWTFGISDEDRAKKEEAEKEATEKLINELPPHLSQLLERYEKQIEPEARFVRFVDKMLPAIINIMAGEAGTFKQDYGIYTLEAIQSGYAERMEKLQSMFPEFDFILLITGLIEQTSQQSLFGTKE
jgi:putative hydrolase of HD superfamily